MNKINIALNFLIVSAACVLLSSSISSCAGIPAPIEIIGKIGGRDAKIIIYPDGTTKVEFLDGNPNIVINVK